MMGRNSVQIFPQRTILTLLYWRCWSGRAAAHNTHWKTRKLYHDTRESTNRVRVDDDFKICDAPPEY